MGRKGRGAKNTERHPTTAHHSLLTRHLQNPASAIHARSSSESAAAISENAAAPPASIRSRGRAFQAEFSAHISTGGAFSTSVACAWSTARLVFADANTWLNSARLNPSTHFT